ncbi:YhgE/Pip domain-containing protein [Nocardia goodfellowii]|uniref:Phage infection (PIP) family protein YhgE n=1 Tax=Nocardia goodfellowii TaxID=882446 RepID=A0ABS4QUR1_9NOCA|nr:DUF3533 domain-containing protein [Nocardia goodfellowii]MBP2194351.1 putative phage infection (PIP) family protein YhgE [Nocardia goodfellowii]
MGLLSLLAVSYLGSVLNSEQHLRDFPLVLVDADQGVYGRQVAAEVTDALAGRVALRVTDTAAAERLLSLGNMYGAVMIPAEFTAQLTALERPAAERGTPPVIEIRTNPRAGAVGASLATELLEPTLADINRRLGVDATERARANGVELSDAALVTLTDPVRISTTQYRPLPAGTGNGISVFYYTLLLVLTGFTGSVLVSAGVDAAVAGKPDVSAWRVLGYKWGLAAVVALVMAGSYQLIAARLGMPIDHHLTLYCFGVFAALAVGVTALGISAATAALASAFQMPILGILSMPINLLLFIALGIPSSGGIRPIEAAPGVYQVLAAFEPMRQVYLGVRSILYFDARADAGLTQAVVMCALGLALGVLVGVLATAGNERFRTRAA